ncbi:hypothetical protein [Facilibium subflavum]|uniref:hypothetical protein n=1 Tax=Facilibium subflavum TaxID=2219058 RepID=UPI000E64C18F|nr:hypothetical protein [Facilibium subflavum]
MAGQKVVGHKPLNSFWQALLILMQRYINFGVVLIISFFCVNFVYADDDNIPVPELCHFDIVLKNNNHNTVPIKIWVASFDRPVYGWYKGDNPPPIEHVPHSDFKLVATLKQNEQAHFNRHTLGGWDSKITGRDPTEKVQGYRYLFKIENIQNRHQVLGTYYFYMSCKAYYRGGKKSAKTGFVEIGSWVPFGDEFMRVAEMKVSCREYSKYTFVIKDKRQIPYMQPEHAKYHKRHEMSFSTNQCTEE